VGFRDPITSASDVDTGRGPSDAGVRIYQDTTVPAVPQGVAEWRTGQMARNATVRLAGGGSGGSAFTIDGGAPQPGQDAPQVRLNVESLPAGGYGPVLRLVAGAGGTIAPDVVLTSPTENTWAPLAMANTAWQPWDLTTSRPSIRQGAAGDVHLEGIVKLAGAPSFAAGARVAALTLPAAYVPHGVAVDRIVIMVNASGAYAGVAWLDIPVGSTSVFLTNITGALITTQNGFLIGATYSALP
jgi:hypothetical protein